MLQLINKFCPKSRFPLSTIFCRPAISAAALLVSSKDPSISTPYPITPSPSSLARNEAARKLLFLFSGLFAKGHTIEKLCHDPRFGGLLSRVNASEVESIVELLRLKRPHLAVDFFLLAKELGFKHSTFCKIIVAHVLAGKRQLKELRSLLQEMVNEEDILSVVMSEKLANYTDFYRREELLLTLLHLILLYTDSARSIS